MDETVVVVREWGLHKVTQLVRAKAQLQQGRSVQHVTGSFQAPSSLPPTWMCDFISMEAPWRGTDHPGRRTTMLPTHSTPGDGGEEREGKGWRGHFFSIREQRQAEGLAGVAIFSLASWSPQSQEHRAAGASW